MEALDPTGRGFLVQFEERWDAEGQQWYCRELVHCVIESGRISELTAYCTGDWDERCSNGMPNRCACCVPDPSLGR